MSGGVGGEELRSSPLSRLRCGTRLRGRVGSPPPLSRNGASWFIVILGNPTEDERNRHEHRQFIRKAIRPRSRVAFSLLGQAPSALPRPL
jgi:hypothetical protein